MPITPETPDPKPSRKRSPRRKVAKAKSPKAAAASSTASASAASASAASASAASASASASAASVHGAPPELPHADGARSVRTEAPELPNPDKAAPEHASPPELPADDAGSVRTDAPETPHASAPPQTLPQRLRQGLAARAWAVYTLGGGVLAALTTRIGMRATTRAEAADSTRLANAKAAEKLGDALRAYHRYEIQGLHNIPSQGPVLVVAHHSLATYDIGLLAAAIRRDLGRKPLTLVDRLIFKVPALGEFLGSIGCVEAAPAEATHLLKGGNIVIVAPGGMREALRSSQDRYAISWENRYGFARLALDTQVPVVCAACAGADELYKVYPSRATQLLLQRFHLPLPISRGIGLTFLPRAQKLVHFVSAPLVPPVAATGEAFAEQARAFQAVVAERMEELLNFPTPLASGKVRAAL